MGEITVQGKLKAIRAHYGSYLAFCRAWGIHRRTCDEWRKPGHKHDAAAVAFVDAVLRIIELENQLNGE